MAETKSGFSSIEEALAAAEQAMGVDDITVLHDGNPGESTASVEVDTQTTPEVEPIEGEQPTDEVEADRPQRLADLVKETEQPEKDSPSVDFDSVIEVDGEEMTIRDLYDRGLRMKDYTQKTQELADQRRELEKAEEVWNLLQDDPVATIAQLALEAQLIDRSQFEAVMAGRPQTQERSGILDQSQQSEVDIDALVAAKVEEVLQQNPQLEKVRREQRSAEVLSNLKALEGKYDLSLEDADRAAVLQMAVKDKEPNLEVVLLRMLRSIEASTEIRDRVKDVSSGRRKSTTPPKETNPRPKNIREAWAMAEAAIN